MSKPLYWIVWVNGASHRFNGRARARGFALVQKALGHNVVTKSVGF